MALLSTIDFIVIIAYFCIVILFGYLASKKETKEGYLIADRKLGFWSSLATISATKTGSVLIVFTALVYLFGFSAMWYFIGASVGYLVFLFFALKLKKESKKRYYTLADYFYFNYGKIPAMFAALTNIVVMSGFLIISLIAVAKIFSVFTGWSFVISAIIVSAVILIYLLLGGFKAVVYTDIIQYIGMLAILAILAITLLTKVSIVTLDWNLFSAGPATIAGFFIIGILIPFASPELWQRVYATKDKKTIKKSILYSILFYIGLNLTLAIIALSVKALLPQLDPDTALIYGFAKILSPGLIGLSIVLLFSAIMSSLDTYAFTASSVIVQDFFRSLNKGETIKLIKVVLTLYIIFATFLGIILKSMIISTYIFTGFIIVLAIPTLATWIKKRISMITLIITFLISYIGIIYFLTTSKELGPSLVVSMLIVSVVGLIVAGIISKFSKIKYKKINKI